MGGGYNLSSEMWLITPKRDEYGNGNIVMTVLESANVGDSQPSNHNRSSRPSINLNSGVIITGGSGLEGDPYTITLPTT